MPAWTIIRSDHPSETAWAALRDGLSADHDAVLGPRNVRPIGLFVYVGCTVMGGLMAETSRGYLHIDRLWLDPAVRGQGVGRKLVIEAEAEASRRGCVGAWLDTYSFAARPFYERLGYRVFGELDGYAKGHRRYFMSKRFQASISPAP